MCVDLPGCVIVVATRNHGKLREFSQLLGQRFERVLGLEDIGFQGDIDETGSSFAENARLKARECSRHSPLPILADDSGLEVAALGGRPGVHSARYAGPNATDEERISRLLEELRCSASARDGRFVCALALAQSGRVLLEAEGECLGVIAEAPRGLEGFGYDPIFLLPRLGRTYAELTAEEKNQYSHRARAVFALLRKLPAARPY
jgi:non-canonical purine NTP pyrophosphatase (RdgB/HAM1 family)